MINHLSIKHQKSELNLKVSSSDLIVYTSPDKSSSNASPPIVMRPSLVDSEASMDISNDLNGELADLGSFMQLKKQKFKHHDDSKILD